VNFLKKLWAEEPVLVATIIPLGVTVGLLTTDQASALTNVVTGAVAAVVQILAAFGIRSKVSPTP
jgi:hypothetical protein